MGSEMVQWGLRLGLFWASSYEKAFLFCKRYDTVGWEMRHLYAMIRDAYYSLTTMTHSFSLITLSSHVLKQSKMPGIKVLHHDDNEN
jgi:hypothetical protein